MYRSNSFLKSKNKSTLTLVSIFLLTCLWIAPAMAAPAGFPTDWVYWMSDPDENGTNNDYRDVQAIYYQVDSEYLYLRLQNRCDCGWSESEHGRWKWFIDTINNDANVQGGTIYDAEFMFMLEDHMDNTLDPADHDHATAEHDLLGELLFLDDLDNVGFDARWGGGTQPHPYFINEPAAGDLSPSPYWRREVGTGTGGFGGSQSVFGEEIGYQMEGQFVDMYFSIEHIGSPDSVCMYWATDQENNNLDQAPNQDRPTVDICFDLEVTGTITINKHIAPASDADASFAFDGDLGQFNLDVVGGAAASVTFADINVGIYDVFEDLANLPDGWLLGSIVCDDPSQDSSIDLVTGLANIDLSAGEEVTCTYTNVEAPVEGGTIVIVKHAVPHSEILFDFESTIPGFEQFTLSDDGDNHTLTIPDLAPGSYEVTEVDIPPGWHLDSLVCVDPDGGSGVDGPLAIIDLDSAEVVTCTYNNGQSATISIQKQTFPTGSQQVFNFSGDLGTFQLSDGQQVISGFLDPDDQLDYVVTEDLPVPGWKLQQIDCFDPTGGSSTDLATGSATLNIEHGDEISCTFINSQLGSISVTKITEPTGTPTSFNFTGDVTGTISDGETITITDMPTGIYTATEAEAAGWDLTAIVCDDDASRIPSTGDIGTRTVTFNLEPGEAVNCSFTNRVHYGRITVDKATLPSASAQVFDFNLSGGSGTDIDFQLTDTAAPFDSGDLLPTAVSATYSVEEVLVEGWDNTSIVCTGSSGAEDPAAIDLDFDETVECVFTNTQRGMITIVKEVLGVPDGEFCFLYFGPEDDGEFCIETSAGTGQEAGDELLAGLWSFAEIIDGPYAVLSMDCDNGDTADAVNLGPGDEVTCTFVNISTVPIPVNHPLALFLLVLMLMATGWYFRPAAMRR